MSNRTPAAATKIHFGNRYAGVRSLVGRWDGGLVGASFRARSGAAAAGGAEIGAGAAAGARTGGTIAAGGGAGDAGSGGSGTGEATRRGGGGGAAGGDTPRAALISARVQRVWGLGSAA
jgi:hypothetical protein